MQIDKLGLPKYGTDDLMDLIYKGKEDLLFNVLADDNDETKKFNKSVELTGTGQQLKFYKSLDIDLKSFDKLLQNEWFMPNSYKSFDIETYVRSICPDNQNSINRVKEELEALSEEEIKERYKTDIKDIQTELEKDLMINEIIKKNNGISKMKVKFNL